MCLVSDRSDDAPGAPTSTPESPEQILVPVRVGDDVISICGDNRYLQYVVHACKTISEYNLILTGELGVPRPYFGDIIL